MPLRQMYTFVLAASLLLAIPPLCLHAEPLPLPPGVTRVSVVFAGGHDTDPRDGGRPVVLVAGALGVTPAVFRDAFSKVHPAPAGSAPSDDQSRQNKAALMAALGKYGITNEQLDAASNHYRYVRSRGELWPTTPAVAFALVKDGVITGYELVSGGAGYTSLPTLTVAGVKGPVSAALTLAFGKDLATNGALATLTLPLPAAAPASK